jgi:biotin operon repressor
MINGVLKLTGTELRVLGAFIDIAPEKPCSSQSRKQVVQLLGFKSVAVLNNFIKSLKDKGVLIFQDGQYRFNPVVLPNKDLQLKFTVA